MKCMCGGPHPSILPYKSPDTLTHFLTHPILYHTPHMVHTSPYIFPYLPHIPTHFTPPPTPQHTSLHLPHTPHTSLHNSTPFSHSPHTLSHTSPPLSHTSPHNPPTFSIYETVAKLPACDDVTLINLTGKAQ